MKVIARARHIRMSPRKVRLVVDLIRGQHVVDAERQLRFSRREASEVVLKLLQSAMANAEHNFQLDRGQLRVALATVDGGPILYRHRPRAFGRSAPIRKRTSHITIELEDLSKNSSESKA